MSAMTQIYFDIRLTRPGGWKLKRFEERLSQTPGHSPILPFLVLFSHPESSLSIKIDVDTTFRSHDQSGLF